MPKDSDGGMKRDGLKDETGSMARIDTVHMRLPDRVTVGVNYNVRDSFGS